MGGGLSKAKRNQCSFNKEDLGGRETDSSVHDRACLCLISHFSDPLDREIF